MGRLNLKEFVGGHPYVGRCKHIKLIKWNVHKIFVYQINEGRKEWCNNYGGTDDQGIPLGIWINRLLVVKKMKSMYRKM